MVSMLSEAERSAILDAEIQRYVALGYRVASRTATAAQLIRPKTFSVAAAVIWTLVLIVGLLIYLFMYMAQSDETVYLTIDESGAVRRQSNNARAGQPCPSCGYENRQQRSNCKRCKAHL